jgi:hypothetical protein
MTMRIRLIGWATGLFGGMVFFLSGIHLTAGYFEAVRSGATWPDGELWRYGPFLIAGLLSMVVGHLLWQRDRSR